MSKSNWKFKRSIHVGLEELIPSGPAGQASLGQEGQILPWQMEQLPSGQEGQTPSGQGEQVPPGQMR